MDTSPLIEYRFTHYSIFLPADSLLKVHQVNHKLYDRFLPHFSKYLESGSTVVDVGAHCGDTVAAMFDANQGLVFIAIEADERRFELLQANVLRIKAFDGNAGIHTINAWVGDGDSTAPPMLAQPLDHLIAAFGARNIRFLKSDTDGLDAEVIRSADSILDRDHPMIYFECEFHNAAQRVAFEELLERLRSKGYEKWVIFDNFGGLMLQTTDVQAIRQLIGYVWRQNADMSTRTIFYFDILVATEADRELVERAAKDYLKPNP